MLAWGVFRELPALTTFGAPSFYPFSDGRGSRFYDVLAAYPGLNRQGITHLNAVTVLSRTVSKRLGRLRFELRKVASIVCRVMSEQTQAASPTPDVPSGAATAGEASSGQTAAPKKEQLPGMWDRFSFACVRFLLRIHAAVWGWHGLYVSAQFFGAMEYLINFKRRRRVRRMLETVLGEPVSGHKGRRLVRAHFMRKRCDKVFYLIVDLLPTERILQNFTIVNRHLLDEGLASGKGVYSMLSHFGQNHVTGMAMSALGYRVAGIRDPNEGAMRRYVQELWRRKHPDAMRTKILYSGNFVRDIYRLLKENHALGSALDTHRVRGERLKTVPVQIYGEERHFLTGTLQIALRCQSYVVQVFMIAEEDFRYRLEILGPMCEPGVKETPELLAEVMQRYANNITTYARRYPDHITRA